MKLLVICGHGAGDPGACANGYTEAERVRVLGQRIKELGGDNVILGDINRDYYADNGISYLDLPSDTQIVELHMDSASPSARGGHVIIMEGLDADEYDVALADFIGGILPGRARTLVYRGDLANPARANARGYGYRLIENGFISSEEDLYIFNNNIDALAKGILSCFGFGANTSVQQTPVAPVEPTPQTNSLDEIAYRVIAREFGDDPYRTQALTAAGYDAKAVQARVNEILGFSSTTEDDLADIAAAVYRGEYGDDPIRSQLLREAGYDPKAVQDAVNRIYYGF